MNWRIIVGLILLILGIRVFLIAVNSEQTGGMTIASSILWVAVGLFFIVRGMTHKEK